jgi:sporadic carbohydrate cluster 2OG-Fe(II) oxygenase
LISHINKDKNFKKNYYKLAKSMLENIVGNELAIQKNINLSIQLPNDESSLLPLHSDTWSGDSPFESVLWIPLVDCYDTKSMFLLNAKKLKIFNKNFNSKKINSVTDLYKKYKNDLKFIKINYGNYLLFNQNLPHGNLINKTNETRISLNCRFKGLFTPYSQKELGSFFSPLKLRAATKIGLEYKHPGEK